MSDVSGIGNVHTLEHRRIEQCLLIFFKCFKENLVGICSVQRLRTEGSM